jgi:hypothetical protein
MFVLAIGLLIGPAAAGVMAAELGLPAAFLAGAGVTAAVMLLTPREELGRRRLARPTAASGT